MFMLPFLIFKKTSAPSIAENGKWYVCQFRTKYEQLGEGSNMTETHEKVIRTRRQAEITPLSA